MREDSTGPQMSVKIFQLWPVWGRTVEREQEQAEGKRRDRPRGTKKLRVADTCTPMHTHSDTLM